MIVPVELIVPATVTFPANAIVEDATVEFGVRVVCATKEPDIRLSQVITPPSAICNRHLSALSSP